MSDKFGYSDADVDQDLGAVAHIAWQMDDAARRFMSHLQRQGRPYPLKCATRSRIDLAIELCARARDLLAQELGEAQQDLSREALFGHG